MFSQSVRSLLCGSHLVGPHPDCASRQTVGRFRESRAVVLMRAALGSLSRASPALAAHIGYRMIATPPRAAERRWQTELRQAAVVSELHLGDTTIALYEWGRKHAPTILMVHGWGARATHTGRMIKPLTDAGFRVVSFDGPAHGHSPGKTTDPIEFSQAVYAAAVFAGPLHGVIAHSFGAAMAMLAMRDWGLAADRYVLISGIQHCKWLLDKFGAYAGLPPVVIERMTRMLAQRHQRAIDWDELSVAEMLRSSNRPALLIHDEEDPEVPISHSETVLSGAPNATLFSTRGLGHHKLLGSPSVIDRVLEFLGDSKDRAPVEVWPNQLTTESQRHGEN